MTDDQEFRNRRSRQLAADHRRRERSERRGCLLVLAAQPGFDAFVVMLHDQGHIATKLMAQNAAAALTIGTPILFASVAHGTGHDIAGKGIANPAAMIEAVMRVSKAKRTVRPTAA